MRESNPFQQDGNWWADRLGKLTASRVNAAMNFLKSGKESTERENLRYEIVAERITNTMVNKYTTPEMAWGVEKEAEAKERFESVTGLIVTDVGFMDHPRIPFCGASPDGFCSDGCAIEVKCPTTRTFMKWVEKQTIPAEHKAQMTLQAAVTGKDVWFVSYDPRMGEGRDLYIRKFSPTPEEIAEVEAACEQFLAEVDALFDFYTTKAVYLEK